MKNDTSHQTTAGKYATEKDGQTDFFRLFRIDIENNRTLIDNTDGVWNGCILEFKLVINDLNRTLKQAIKYLSQMRVRGESVPANILLVSLNTSRVYLYRSEDYFEEIHKIYVGAASRDNEGFVGEGARRTFDINEEEDVIGLNSILKKREYLPIRIDENCIVGWGRRYYRENPKASKGNFIGDNEGKVKITGEIREPVHFKGLILPYRQETNERFKYLMDMLNDSLHKQELGAFYTPTEYCEKAAELVRMAISRVPEGNRYIIIDRCAGTGNLESVLTDEELSHCVLSTYEYYEYKVLCERLGDKVDTIIPPNESLVRYKTGFVDNANALEKEYIDNKYIRGFIDDPQCTVILLENPPYQDSSAAEFVDGEGNRARVARNDSFIKREFKAKALGALREQRGAAREISNLFIWSAFEHYLRQPTDSYIVFSPVKYFKSIGLVRKEFIRGFLFNRKHFHASPSAISCILWGNGEDRHDRQEFSLTAYDVAEGELRLMEEVVVRKVYSPISEYNDRRVFESDTQSAIVCASDGNELVGWHKEGKHAKGNDNIIAYMAVNGFTTDSKHRYLMRLPYMVGVEQSFGFYLRRDNFVSKLPLFCAKLYPQAEWWHKEVYYTTSDRGDAYMRDKDLLRSCLIYTCLCVENKCKTIEASDGRTYYNELCMDDGTIAWDALAEMVLNGDDRAILGIWEKVLGYAKECDGYRPSFKYGTYQIVSELNTFDIDENGDKQYHHPELNSHLVSLRVNLKEYYRTQIQDKLFEYELLK